MCYLFLAQLDTSTSFFSVRSSRRPQNRKDRYWKAVRAQNRFQTGFAADEGLLEVDRNVVVVEDASGLKGESTWTSI
jgi:hypothetical protein